MDKREENIKNKPALFAGAISGLLSVLFLPELFQTVVAWFFLKVFDLQLVLIFPSLKYLFTPGVGLYQSILVTFSPLLFLVLIGEAGTFVLRKTFPGFFRYSLILFLLIHVGYFILFVFYNAFMVILAPTKETDWNIFFTYLNLGDIKPLIYAVLIIIIIAVYLNVLSRRILNYINFKRC